MRLFHKNECPFCWKVRIALAELDWPYDLITLGPDDDRTELRQFTPQDSTPVLVANGHGIWESSVILEFIHDCDGGEALLPTEPSARAQARLLHAYSDGKIGPALREVVFEKRAKPEAEWDLDRIAKGDAAWRERLDWLEKEIGDGPFFVERFSFAECALIPRFGLAERYGVGVDDRHPKLAAWWAEMRERPSALKTRPEGWDR